MIELEAGDALTVGQYGWLGKFPQLAAVYERLQEVLLGVVIVVDDLGHPLAEPRQVLDIRELSAGVRNLGPALG